MIQQGLEIVGAFTALLTLIAQITPSKKDDKIVTKWEKFGRFADSFGIQFKKRI